MPQSAYIKLVDDSTQQTITLEEVKQMFERYIEQTGYTGQQLGWDYTAAAFPYTIEEKPEGEGKWFYLKGKDPDMYKGLYVAVGTEPVNSEENDEENERHYIQFILPDQASHGDKSKGNEFCRYLAKKLQAELHMFNGRVMYFHPQK